MSVQATTPQHHTGGYNYKTYTPDQHDSQSPNPIPRW